MNAYAASCFLRPSTATPLGKRFGATNYRGGGLVLSDRYTTSNAVHQASKLQPAEWEDFFCCWLFDFEYENWGFPARSGALSGHAHRHGGGESPPAGKPDPYQGDIHEADTAYLALCRRTALAAAGLYGWTCIRCVTPDGALRPAEDIHAEVWQSVLNIL